MTAQRKPDAWLVPHRVTFKNLDGTPKRTSCPPEHQAELEGTIAWSAEVISDGNYSVRDRDCVIHGCKPLFMVPDVDELAQFIRSIDGSHRLSAGGLAERICDWIAGGPNV